MKRYSQLTWQFLGAGAQFGTLMGLFMAVTSSWPRGVVCGLFSWASITLGVPFILLIFERKKRGPTKFQFRLRTILALFTLMAFVLASWQWTNTHGIQQLADKYKKDAGEVVQLQIEKYSLPDTADSILDKVDFFVNPRAILPFIITVESDEAFKIDYSATGSARTSATHVWFFGYLSEPLSKPTLIGLFVMFGVFACVLLILLMLWLRTGPDGSLARQSLAE